MCSEGCFGLQLDPEKLRLEEDGESESIRPSEEFALAFRSAPRQAVGQEKEDVLQHYSECLSMCVAELEALQGKLGKHASTACHDIPRTEEIGRPFEWEVRRVVRVVCTSNWGSQFSFGQVGSGV